MTRIVLFALSTLLANAALAGEYPFTKENKIETKVHRYVPQMIFVDLDKDKDIDIIARTGSHHGVLSWWENKKKGKKWQERDIDSGLPIPFEPGSIAAGDIDGDKDLDLVMLTRYKGVHWIDNRKKGKKWKPHPVNEKVGGAVIAIGDVDGDGDGDIVYGGKGIFWIENLGKGKEWEQPQEMYTAKRTVRDLALVDIDNDEDLDVVFHGGSYGRDDGLFILSNDDGPWNARMLRALKPTQFEVADHDDDGDPDILLVTGRDVILFKNHEHSGMFAEEPLGHRSDDPAESATLMDVDNDGHKDLIYGTAGGRNGIWWYKNPGDEDPEADWEGKAIEAQTGTPQVLYPVDFDKDGDEDLVAGLAGLGEWRHIEKWYENKSRKSKKKKKKKKSKKRKKR